MGVEVIAVEVKAENKRGNGLRVLSIILYVVGLVVGMTLALGIIWANLEASLFDTAIRQEARLTSLRCPPLITPNETAVIRATFHNEAERALNFLVRANISEGYITLKRLIPTTLRLEPGEREELSWPVTAADAAFGRFVLARVMVLRSPPYPARDAACGILLVRIPFLTGGQVLALALLVSLGGLAGGLALWVRQARPLSERQRAQAMMAGWLALLVALLILIGLLRLWVIGVLVVALMVLMAGVLLERYGHR